MKYFDGDGNPTTLNRLVRSEPDWAESRIKEGEKAADRVAELEAINKDLHADYNARMEELHNTRFKRTNAEQRVAELAGFLQQVRDDYELALRENEKLLAGLEKMRGWDEELRQGAGLLDSSRLGLAADAIRGALAAVDRG